ncbi:MAG: FtsK/SpoIIIE domain-containing protein [Planctomycetales bacterium]
MSVDFLTPSTFPPEPDLPPGDHETGASDILPPAGLSDMTSTPNPFDSEQYRELISDLQTTVQHRVQAEQQLTGEEDLLAGGVTDTLDQALEKRSAQYDQALAEAHEQHASAQQQLQSEYNAQVQSLRSTFDNTTHLIRQKFADDEQKTHAKYDENSWLVSSMTDDSSESSPKRQFERLQAELKLTRDQLVQQTTDLETIFEQAKTLARKRRYKIDEEEEAPDPEPIPENREAALQAFNAAGVALRAHFKYLSRQLLPQVFIGPLPLLLLLLVAGGFFAALFLLLDPTTIGQTGFRPNDWLAISAAAAVFLSLLTVFILFRIGIGQTSAAMALLQQDLINLHWSQQAWQQYAREDLKHFQTKYNAEYLPAVERRQKALEQFAHIRDNTLHELTVKLQQDLHAETEQHNQALQAATTKFQQDSQAADLAYQHQVNSIRLGFEQDRDQLIRFYQQRSREREARHSALWQQLSTEWSQNFTRFSQVAQAYSDLGRQTFPAWDQILRPDWQPEQTANLPGVRLGDLLVNLADIPGGLPEDARLLPAQSTFPLPAIHPFPDSPPLLLNCRDNGRMQGVLLLRLALLRLLTQITPGNVRVTILDPVGLGENFAAFMHLADFDELLITSRIWTEPAHIEQQLANLTEHMENVFQKYLRNDFASIEEYNHHAGEVAEPYRILVVANFPTGFSERATQRLLSIVTNGPRCGVHTIISRDMAVATYRGEELAQLERASHTLHWNGKQFEDRTLTSIPIPLQSDPLPTAADTVALVRRIGELSKHLRRVEVPFHRIVPAPNAYWSADSRSQIDVPLGRAGATHLQHLRLGKGTSQHVLVAGKTGSGKSTLLHILVTNLALRYSPDEIEFYLVDFKKGVEFKTYATHHLPHARVISIESDREFGVSVLQRLDAILEERGQLFRAAGVQDIASYRNDNPDAIMPRILLMVDEFQEFFVEDDRYSQTAALLLDRLVRQGRAFGIHVLLGSQTLGGAYSLARTTIGQMSVRIALQCSESDAHLILSEENSAARLLTRPGEAIYNDANGLVEGNNPFQIAWMNDSDRDVLLAQIEARARSTGRTWPEPIIFEGNVPADPLRNAALAAAVQSPASEAAGEAQPESAWLGESVAITGPTDITFPRRSGTNLLVVGQDADAALGILANTLIALAPSTESTGDAQPRMTLCSGTSAEDHAVRWSKILQLFPRAVRITGPDDVDPVISELAAEVTRRQEERAPQPALFIVIDDLSRFRSLRKSDDDFGFASFGEEKKVSTGKLLGDILRDGPAVGVHAIIWCDSYNNVDRWFQRQTLREFEMRVLFQMSGTDSSNLIDSPAASRLGTNRAILYSDERGTLEKFRPYGPPNDEWLRWIASHRPPPATPPGNQDPPNQDPTDGLSEFVIR